LTSSSRGILDNKNSSW